MPVNSEHPAYTNIKDRWELVRDIIVNDASDRIRWVDPEDPERSQQYREDAVLTNFTDLTKVGLTGLVFRKPAEKKIPSALKYIEEDATGTNIDLEQLSQYIISELLVTGRMGLLVDFPVVEGRVTKQDENRGLFQPRINPYTAESIINWDTISEGGVIKLSLVVLKEEVLKRNPEDKFQWVKETEYRVLYLEDGVYKQEIRDKGGKIISGPVTPRDANRNTFDEIPFVFIGSENNDPKVDKIPLYDMAVINLSHYKNSADFEESVFICGQPTLFMSTKDPMATNDLYPEGVRLGSRRGYTLQEGEAQLLQANANQLADAAMKRKEEQAASIGARLIAPPGGRETAEAAKIRYGSQNSALFTLTSNASKGIKQLLIWCARYKAMAITGIEYVLNRKFYDENTDPNLLAQMWMGIDRQVISKKDARNYLRNTQFMDFSRTDEDIEDDIETEVDPLEGVQLPLGDNNDNTNRSPETPDSDGQAK